MFSAEGLSTSKGARVFKYGGPSRSTTVCIIFFTVFTSRRRHMKCLSDWSSDVCSSDLNTSHDPAGPRSVDRSEKGQEGANHTASGRRRDRPNRTAYPAAAGKAEKRGRPGGGPRAPGTSVQPQTGREEPGEGGCDPRAREVSRVRPHAGQRIPWQASPDHSQPRNGEGLDDRSAAMAVPETKSG